MASGLYDTSTPEGKKMEEKYGKPGEGGTSIGDLATDLWEGYSGKNQANIKKPQLSTTRADEERALGLDARGMQLEYANLLRAQMSGQGPSLAQSQYQRNLGQGMRAVRAAQASARGANVALAGRTAGQQAAMVARQGAGDAATLRLQEQLAAQQQFGGLGQGMRLGDMQARGLSIEEEKARLAALAAYNQTMAGVGEGEAERKQKAYGGVATGIGGLVSDLTAKTDAQPIGYNQYSYGGGRPSFGAYGNAPTPSYPNLVATQAPQQAAPNPRFGIAPPGPPSMGVTAAGGIDPGASTASPAMSRDSSGALTMADYNPKVKPAGQPGPPPDQNLNPVTGLMSGLGGVGGSSDQQSKPQDPLSQLLDKLVERQKKQQDEKAESPGGLSDMFSGLGSVGSDVYMKDGIVATNPYSDKETKRDTAPHGDLVVEAAQVQPFSFRYKPEAAAAQGVSTEERTGVMANRVPGSLETNPIYAPTVEKDEQGMASVNAGQATMANIAVTSDMAKQLLELRQEVADLKNLSADKPRSKKDDGIVKSDPDSKDMIRALTSENAALKNRLGITQPSEQIDEKGNFREVAPIGSGGKSRMRKGLGKAAKRSQQAVDAMPGTPTNLSPKQRGLDEIIKQRLSPGQRGLDAITRYGGSTRPGSYDKPVGPPEVDKPITSQADMMRLSRQEEPSPGQSEQSATPYRALQNIDRAIRKSGGARAPALETLSEERQNAVKTELQTIRERTLGDAAAKLAAAKTHAEKVKYLRQYEAARGIGATTEGPGQLTNNPGMDFQLPLAESLRQRGVKMSAKQLKKLQTETPL